MNDDIIKSFIADVVSGNSYALLPSDYNMQDVIDRARVVCPDTPDHIFRELLS